MEKDQEEKNLIEFLKKVGIYENPMKKELTRLVAIEFMRDKIKEFQGIVNQFFHSYEVLQELDLKIIEMIKNNEPIHYRTIRDYLIKDLKKVDKSIRELGFKINILYQNYFWS